MTDKSSEPPVAPDPKKDPAPGRIRFIWEDGDIEILEEGKGPIEAEPALKTKRRR